MKIQVEVGHNHNIRDTKVRDLNNSNTTVSTYIKSSGLWAAAVFRDATSALLYMNSSSLLFFSPFCRCKSPNLSDPITYKNVFTHTSREMRMWWDDNYRISGFFPTIYNNAENHIPVFWWTYRLLGTWRITPPTTFIFVCRGRHPLRMPNPPSSCIGFTSVFFFLRNSSRSALLVTVRRSFDPWCPVILEYLALKRVLHRWDHAIVAARLHQKNIDVGRLHIPQCGRIVGQVGQNRPRIGQRTRRIRTDNTVHVFYTHIVEYIPETKREEVMRRERGYTRREEVMRREEVIRGEKRL